MSTGKFAGQPLPDFGVVRAISGASGKVLWGHSEPGGFGETLACMGDVNGDGKDDFAVGLGGGGVLGGWYMCSGKDGSVLYSRLQKLERGTRPCSLASVPDTTADGISDLVVGWPNRNVFHGEPRLPSRVEVVSGANGNKLLQIDSTRFERDLSNSNAHVIGRRVWGTEDLNGDGKGDFAFTCHIGLGQEVTSYVLVSSGADGSVLYDLLPERASEENNPTLAVIGDRDEDGVRDWLLGSSESDLNIYEVEDLEPDGLPEEWWQPQGDVVVYSSASGEPLFSLRPDKRSPRFGHAVAGGGDFDADGVPDVIVTDYGGEVTFKGLCYVYSGADGSLIRKHEGKATWDYGASLIVVDDLDGDDCADYVVGCMRDYPGSGGTGFAIVYSGRTGEIRYFLGGRYQL